MAEFIAFEQQTEVLGQTMLSAMGGMGEQAVPFLEQYGLTDIQPEQWYPQQLWLDFLRTISGKDFNGMFDLVSIGMQIPDRAIFPPHINSISSALQSIDAAYYMNHRNGKIGNYYARVIDDHQIEMVCENPYPCDFDYGLIYGLAKRFCKHGQHFTVRHDDHCDCRQKGGDSCTYYITWK